MTTSPAAFPDWSTLTLAQQAALTATTAPLSSVGLELLDFGLSLGEDISGDLDVSRGDVQWASAASIHRSCDVTIARELAWGTVLARPYATRTDLLSGLCARRNLGAFVLATPESDLGPVVQAQDGPGSIAFAVTGQDRNVLLARQIGYSYVVSAGVLVLSALAQVFLDAGLSGVLIDSSASLSTVPTDMVWALVSSNSSRSSPAVYTQPADAVADTSSAASTWMDVVNDLLGLIGYAAVWCDEDGYFRCTPYADPATRPPLFVFDADDGVAATVARDGRKFTRDLYGIPNQWVGIWSNPPSEFGAPTADNGGIVTINNVSDGLSSQTARQLIYPSVLQFNAASTDDLASQVALKAATDQRIVTTFTVGTVPWLGAGHEDVLSYRDSRTPAGLSRVMATAWQHNFDGSDMTWTWATI